MVKKHIFDDGRWSNIDVVPPCENCKYCTDVLSDYTNGDYLWLCNISKSGSEYNLDNGMLKKCPLNKEKQND